jgi:hypothetical protein
MHDSRYLGERWRDAEPSPTHISRKSSIEHLRSLGIPLD